MYQNDPKNVPEGQKNQIYETGLKRPDQQKDKKNKSTRKTQKNLPEKSKKIYQKDIKVMINWSHTKKEDIYQKPKRPEVHNDRPDY